jgi:hypothetical protein
MKRLAVVLVLGAMALATHGADAQAAVRHRTAHPEYSHPSANAYGYARPERSQSVFESNAQGRQSYPNPDRDLPQPCGC